VEKIGNAINKFLINLYTTGNQKEIYIFPNRLFNNRINQVYRIIRTSKYQYQLEYVPCNKKYCHCQKDGIGHGPYWYMYDIEAPVLVKYIGKELKFISGKILYNWINDELVDKLMSRVDNE